MFRFAVASFTHLGSLESTEGVSISPQLRFHALVSPKLTLLHSVQTSISALESLSLTSSIGNNLSILPIHSPRPCCKSRKQVLKRLGETDRKSWRSPKRAKSCPVREERVTGRQLRRTFSASQG